jgi:predicted transcriptional regulator
MRVSLLLQCEVTKPVYKYRDDAQTQMKLQPVEPFSFLRAAPARLTCAERGVAFSLFDSAAVRRVQPLFFCKSRSAKWSSSLREKNSQCSMAKPSQREQQ